LDGVLRRERERERERERVVWIADTKDTHSVVFTVLLDRQDESIGCTSQYNTVALNFALLLDAEENLRKLQSSRARLESITLFI